MLDADGDPLCMKVSFWRDRSFFNKFFYLVYKVMRIFFVAIYFYFYPPISILLTFWLPMFFRMEYKAQWVEMNAVAGDPLAGVPSAYTLKVTGVTQDQFLQIRDMMQQANVTNIDDLRRG